MAPDGLEGGTDGCRVDRAGRWGRGLLRGAVVRVVDQKTAVVPLHADTLADPNKLLASIRSLVDLA